MVENTKTGEPAAALHAEPSPTQDKIRGCLIGGAAGDALGYAIEFDREDLIRERFGPDGITAYLIDPETGKAIISDDTQMTLFTANGLLFTQTRGAVRGICGPPRVYLALAYRDWLITQTSTYHAGRMHQDYKMGGVSWLLEVPELYARRAPGNTCMTSLLGLEEQEDYITAPKKNNSKGCGGIMRVAPMGLVRYRDMDALDLEGAQLAAITHCHSLGYMPAAVLTHIIHRIVFSPHSMTLRNIVLEARDAAAKLFKGDRHIHTLTDLIDLAVSLSENENTDLENIHRLGEGWVGEEALAIAVYCALRHQDDFSAGIIAAVNHNGDSDSTGAIAGNMLGALVGYAKIDQNWKTDLELHDVILELSDDLYKGYSLDSPDATAREAWKRKYILIHR